jgi:hypothetical protein
LRRTTTYTAHACGANRKITKPAITALFTLTTSSPQLV